MKYNQFNLGKTLMNIMVKLNFLIIKDFKWRFTIFLFAFSVLGINAQNTFFTHIEAAKNFYNPALSENQLSATVLHRNNQLFNEIKFFTSAAGIDIPLAYIINRFKNASISLYGFDERFNHAGYIRQTGGMISVNHEIYITKKSTLALGLQFSSYYRTFSNIDFRTGSQWDPYMGFQPGLSNGEDIVHQKLNINSLSAGLIWRIKDANNNSLVNLGLAGFQLNKPYDNFLSSSSRLLPRYTLFANCKLFDNGKFILIPEFSLFSFQQKQNFSFILKSGVYTFDNNPFLPFGNGKIFFETSYVNRNFWLGAMLEQPQYNFGISYDFPLSNSQIRNIQAWEFHITIKLFKKRTSMKTSIQDYSISQVRKFFNEKINTSIDHEQTKVNDNKEHTEQIEIKETNKPVVLALKKDFKFNFNDATLNTEACAYLDELTDFLINNKKIVIEIIGHTDDVGTREANQIISYKRAEVVANYLISKGIDPKRIKKTAKLDSEPLYPNNSPENRAKNRRVEFILYYYNQ